MLKVTFFSLLMLFMLMQISAQYLYETQLTGSADRMSLIKAPGDSLKAILRIGGTGGNVAFYHITPRGEISESYRVGWSQSSDFGNDIVATSDGNYAFVGHTNFSPSNGADFYFGKMTPSGALLWQYSAGNVSTDFGRTILQTQDGGILVGGMSQAPTGPSVYRSYLIKLNQDGEVLWEKTFKNNTGSQEILDMVEFPSGTVAAVGYYSGPLSLGIDGILYFLNPDGSLLTPIGIGGPGNDVIEAVMMSPEGTLIVAGHTESYSFGQADFFLSEINEEGQVLWTRIMGSPLDERSRFGMGIDMDSEGNIVIAGYNQLEPYAFERQGVLLKTNRQGELLWTRLLEDATQPTAVVVLDNDDIVVGGGNDNFDFTTNFLYRTNASGRSSCGQDSFLLFSVSPAFIFSSHSVVGLEEVDQDMVVVGPNETAHAIAYNYVSCIDSCAVRAAINLLSPITIVNEATFFTNASTNATEFSWWIDDNPIADTNDLSYSFSELGAHTIKLVAANNTCTDTAFLQLQVVPSVNATFDYYQELMVVQFDGSQAVGNSLHWDFGDGNNSTLVNPKHIYDQLGTYEVCLTVERNGESATSCQYILVAVTEDIGFAVRDDHENTSTNYTRYEDVTCSKDGGYATIGTIYGAGNSFNLILQKYRADGTVKWQSRIANSPGFADEIGISVIECHDLGYLLGGEVYNVDGNNGVLIARTDSLGQLKWTYNFRATGPYNGAFDVLQTPDRGFLICGERSGNGFLLKLDEFGAQEWYREYYDTDRCTGIQLLEDGTTLLAGNTSIGSLLFLNVNNQGEIISSNAYQVDGLIRGGELTEAADGNFYLGVGATVAEEPKVGLLKLNGAGEVLQSHFFQAPFSTVGTYSVEVHETADQHIFLTMGRTFSIGLIAYLTADGTPVWIKQIKYPDEFATVRGAALNYNDHLIVTGATDYGAFDAGILLQIDSSGQLCNTVNNMLEPSPMTLMPEIGITDSIIVDTLVFAFNNMSAYSWSQEQEVFCYNELSCVPSAAFSVEVDDNIIHITNNSTNFDALSWSFGDNNMSTNNNPSHTYLQSGNYTICLTLSNECGIISECQDVVVGPQSCAPQAAFAFSQQGSGPVQFIDNSTAAETWFWDFGDGLVSAEQEPLHNYPAGGIYPVCLLVTNECSSDILCQDIYVEGCQANALFYVEIEQLTVSFVTLADDITSWQWDFGDGTSTTEITPVPVHTYEAGGIYEVCLTVYEEACDPVTYCLGVEVTDCSPVADFSYEQIAANGFAFAEETERAETLLWDFGDGTMLSAINPTHYYDEPGIYTVCLTATAYSMCGEDDTICQDIEVTECLLMADFDYEQLESNGFSFIELTTGADSWFWDFGDGATSTEQYPTHYYAVYDVYEVCLTAINECDEKTICQDVKVTDCEPTSSFVYEKEELTVSFYDESLLANSWFWDFGDGNFSIETSPVHNYTMPAIHEVCLVTENTCGVDTLCQTIDLLVGLTDAEVVGVEVKVWPNPVQTQLFVQLIASNELIDEFTFEILDQYGRTLSIMAIDSSSAHSLSLDALTAGLYYYRIKKEGMPLFLGKVLKI